jgi:hypothetical protein
MISSQLNGLSRKNKVLERKKYMLFFTGYCANLTAGKQIEVLLRCATLSRQYLAAGNAHADLLIVPGNNDSIQANFTTFTPRKQNGFSICNDLHEMV